MARQQIAAVLDAGTALEHALCQVTDHRGHDQQGSTQQAQQDLAETPVALMPTAKVIARLTARPPYTPSQLLPGLTCGASLRLPKALPEK